jgi:hypothetical protein
MLLEKDSSFKFKERGKTFLIPFNARLLIV